MKKGYSFGLINPADKTKDRWNLKALRKLTKNKAEYLKAKLYYRVYRVVHIQNDGTFVKAINDFHRNDYIHVDDGRCLRCGKCCKLVDKDNNFTDVDCGLLTKDKEGNFMCLIYNMPMRIGCRIDEDGLVPPEMKKDFNIICIPRIWQSEKIEGCPYNSELEGWM